MLVGVHVLRLETLTNEATSPLLSGDYDTHGWARMVTLIDTLAVFDAETNNSC